ncbi:MAG: hypothetical protein ACRENP_26545 [Longimicrobiales bacterium]
MKSKLLVSALLLASACAAARSNAASRFTGQVPLQVTVRGSLYTGSATMTRGAGNQTSGTLAIAGPVEVKGTLAGRIANNELTLDLTYDIAQNGCKGTMRLNGPIGSSTVVEGTAEAQDSCVGRMTGTFKLGKP